MAKTLRAAAVTGCLLGASAVTPASAQFSDIVGRWRQTTRTLPGIAVLAIERCGDIVCGRAVGSGGRPGREVIRFEIASDFNAVGTLILRRGTVAVSAFRDGDELVFRTPPRRLPGGTAQGLTARFVRAGR